MATLNKLQQGEKLNRKDECVITEAYYLHAAKHKK